MDWPRPALCNGTVRVVAYRMGVVAGPLAGNGDPRPVTVFEVGERVAQVTVVVTRVSMNGQDDRSGAPLYDVEPMTPPLTGRYHSPR